MNATIERSPVGLLAPTGLSGLSGLLAAACQTNASDAPTAARSGSRGRAGRIANTKREGLGAPAVPATAPVRTHDEEMFS